MARALDDALRGWDGARAAEEARRQRLAAEEAAQHSKYKALVADFLARMEALGSPGAKPYKSSHGALRRAERVRRWLLVYEPAGDDRAKTLELTTDGRVPCPFGATSKSHYMPYTERLMALSDAQLATLAQSMAEVLRSNGG